MKPDTAQYLVTVEQYGKRLKDDFINKCSEDPFRFENTRKLVKVKTFATEKITRKIVVGNKVKNIVIQRDIWGTLLAATMKHNI